MLKEISKNLFPGCFYFACQANVTLRCHWRSEKYWGLKEQSCSRDKNNQEIKSFPKVSDGDEVCSSKLAQV